MVRALFVGFLATGCSSVDDQAFRVSGCDLASLRVLVFQSAATCTAQRPGAAESGTLDPAADSGWVEPSAELRLDVPPQGRIAVVAQCRDAEGIVREWGCDLDDDGRLEVDLEPVCAASCASSESCPVGSQPWEGGGGEICLAQCLGCGADGDADADSDADTDADSDADTDADSDADTDADSDADTDADADVECGVPEDCPVPGDACLERTCDSGVCGTATMPCADGIDCTDDGCAAGICAHAPNPDRCAEPASLCDPVRGCVEPPDCDEATPCAGEGSFCAPESCVEGTCVQGASPCVATDAWSCTGVLCDEAGDACSEPPDDLACVDADFCTIDRCQPQDGAADPTTGCTHATNGCQDGNPDTEDTCIPGEGCSNVLTCQHICRGNAPDNCSPVACGYFDSGSDCIDDCDANWDEDRMECVSDAGRMNDCPAMNGCGLGERGLNQSCD